MVTFTHGAYPTSTTRSEVSVRDEFLNTLDGKGFEISKKSTGLLRSMQRDADNKLITCPCADPEPDKDTFCPICFGEGFLWSEDWLDFYSVEMSGQKNAVEEKFRSMGSEKTSMHIFYLRYDIVITKDDKIVTLSTDQDGKLTKPHRREHIFRLNTVYPLRLDNGRIEYFRVKSIEEDVKYLNHPGLA